MNMPPALRILVVTNMYPDLDRPSLGSFVEAQVRSLRKAGCEVDVLLIPGYRSRLHYLWALGRVFLRTCSRRYDVVHAHYGLSALSALSRWRTPLVVTFHGSDVLIGRIQPLLSRLAARLVDASIVVSRQLHAVIGGAYLPCGVDMDRYQAASQSEARRALGLPTDQRLVLFPFDPDREVKRHHLAVAAVELLQAEGLAISLLTVHGVANEAMPRYFNASDLLVLTSHSEGSPTAIKEALACNLPVVAVSVGDVPYLLEGVTGVWVCDGNPRSIADGIRAAIAPGVREACNGREHMARYANSAIASQLIDLYTGIVKSHLRRRARISARDLAFRLLRTTGLGQTMRALRKQGHWTILAYHDPSPGVLDRHLDYLSRHYTLMPLAEVLRAREYGSPLPRRPLVITFDDGHRGNAALYPVFKRHAVRPTVFLCSAIAGTARGFWFQHVPASQRQVMKGLPESERRAVLAAQGFQRDANYDPPEALSAADIEKLREVVDFQAHTRFHPVLPTCSDAQAQDEIAGCRTELLERFGLHTEVLAYPNGDFSERDASLARQAGFGAAVTVTPGFNDSSTDLFRLQRICIPDDASLSELVVKASGLWAWFRRPASGVTTTHRSLGDSLPKPWPRRLNNLNSHFQFRYGPGRSATQLREEDR